MTETPDLTLRQWFGKLIRGQHHIAIGGEDDPYMLRWYLIPRNKRLNIYLHQFIRSDDDRALHDHPWWFWSFVLAGHYYEHREDGKRIKRHWLSMAYRAAKTRHRVELPKSNDPMSLLEREDCCWTIVITGPRTRDWGFWCPAGRFIMNQHGVTSTLDVERFIPHSDWGAAGCGEPFTGILRARTPFWNRGARR
ncbi:hypothetical protein [Mycobacteroides franklinii]|uniref:Uncharacterized protein n=1 Tax=Mycobacteroides franklinii TaxID=948102 RepID=A0A4R5P7C9_9MYCO|nr:hypothetical protein [Mycobacteroides franklinii]ORA62180.1 hypothetical protein BST24_08535 [Mycobacteroides franklinii]TDH18977.1 hypothetical protein EJ571_20555 [Mycobacteroides franklinii]